MFDSLKIEVKKYEINYLLYFKILPIVVLRIKMILYSYDV